MLVIERRYGESLYLTLEDGQRIKIEVVGTNQHRTKLGITAPQEVIIEREELLDKLSGHRSVNGNRAE